MAIKFRDVLEFGAAVVQSMNKQAETQMKRVQKDYDRSVHYYERRYANCSNQQLKELFNNSTTSAEKRACVNLLNERKQNGKD